MPSFLSVHQFSRILLLQLDHKVAKLEQLLSTEMQSASKLEHARNQSERKCTSLHRQMQELQELDKQSAVFISELKRRLTDIERENIELERQKSALAFQMTTVRARA